jgi:hypothetical protein
MPVLRNPRHEKFSQLIASGIKPTEAYTSLGYSKAGAAQSANNLLKRTDVRERVNEIQSLAAQSSAEEVAFDQKRVLNRLDVLSRKAEELGQIAAAARCEELIGKHRGMFVDRSDHTFQFSGKLREMSPEQLAVLEEDLLSMAFQGDQAKMAEHRRLLEAGPVIEGTAVVIDAEVTPVETRST